MRQPAHCILALVHESVDVIESALPFLLEVFFNVRFHLEALLLTKLFLQSLLSGLERIGGRGFVRSGLRMHARVQAFEERTLKKCRAHFYVPRLLAELAIPQAIDPVKGVQIRCRLVLAEKGTTFRLREAAELLAEGNEVMRRRAIVTLRVPRLEVCPECQVAI